VREVKLRTHQPREELLLLDTATGRAFRHLLRTGSDGGPVMGWEYLGDLNLDTTSWIDGLLEDSDLQNMLDETEDIPGLRDVKPPDPEG
jgi:hypothetical protein